MHLPYRTSTKPRLPKPGFAGVRGWLPSPRQGQGREETGLSPPAPNPPPNAALRSKGNSKTRRSPFKAEIKLQFQLFLSADSQPSPVFESLDPWLVTGALQEQATDRPFSLAKRDCTRSRRRFSWELSSSGSGSHWPRKRAAV